MAERLEAGIVGVNNALPSVAFAPMGGVKQSGLGREGAALGLEEFEDVRYLALRTSDRSSCAAAARGDVGPSRNGLPGSASRWSARPAGHRRRALRRVSSCPTCWDWSSGSSCSRRTGGTPSGSRASPGRPALVAIPFGAYVARQTSSRPPHRCIIGLLVIVALGAVVLSERARVLRGTGGAVAAGGASGFMNVTAGVGGPAIVLYAVSTAWEHRKFVATFQFYSIFTNLGSLAAKGGLPHVAPPRSPCRSARWPSAWSAARSCRGTSTTSGPPARHRARAGRRGLHRRQGLLAW